MKRLCYMIFVAAFLAGCTSLKTPEINGVLVDAETGKPIERARIYVKWQKTISGPGGKTGGGIAKELRLQSNEDGSFVLPAYTLRNCVPYPFGQGGSFYMIVYAHGYKYKNYSFRETDNFYNPGYSEFKDIDHTIVVKMVEIKTEKECWDNMKELDVKDSSFDLDDYQYFIEKYPKSTNAPRAQYYMGYTYEYEIRNYEKAIEEYEKVLKNYPNTDAAKSAEEHIKILKRDKGRR